MLCLIFTKQRLLAGTKLRQSELLQVNGRYYIDYGGQSMSRIFQENLKSITDSYRLQRKELGLEPQKSIPTALAFPVDIDANGSARSKVEIMGLLKSTKVPDLELFHADNIAYSFLYGLTNHPQVATEPCVVLEALDDHLNLCYYNIEAKNGRQSPGDPESSAGNNPKSIPFNFVPLKSLGYATGMQSLYRKIVKEFTQAGLKLDIQDETRIQEFLQGNVKGQTIHLTKNQGSVNINAYMDISENLYEEALTENKISLASRLNHSKLDHLGIKKVVLLGEYLNNSVLQNYLNRDLQIGNKLLLLEKTDNKNEFRIIVEGLARKIFEIQRAREEEERRRREEERRRREEEERRRREMELRTQMAREALLMDIKSQCVELSKQSVYEQQFIPQGDKIGIPKEVIKWNIQEAIRMAELNKPINIQDDDLNESPLYPNNEYSSPPPPPNRPIEPSNNRQWNNNPRESYANRAENAQDKQVVAPPAPIPPPSTLPDMDVPKNVEMGKKYPFDRESAQTKFSTEVKEEKNAVNLDSPVTQTEELPVQDKLDINTSLEEKLVAKKELPPIVKEKAVEPTPKKTEEKKVSTTSTKAPEIKTEPLPPVKKEEKKVLNNKKAEPVVDKKKENPAPEEKKGPVKAKKDDNEGDKKKSEPKEVASKAAEKKTVKQEPAPPKAPSKKVVDQKVDEKEKKPIVNPKAEKTNEKVEKTSSPSPAKKEAKAVDTPDKEAAKTPTKKAVPKRKKVIETDKSLESIFEIEGVLLDPEFITKKVIHIINHDTKVLKILPNSDLDNPKRVEAFNRLYEKELVYYQELSEIYTAKEGQYYFRDYIERNTLKDYVRRVGLDKKDSFEKINSNDLKLILEVLREVKSLTVSHANLTEFNILVISKRRWTLQKDMEIKLVGFTSQDCEPKEMEAQLHKIWAKLIGSDIYAEFRKKFNI